MNKKGLTLIEVLVALSIGATVTAGAFTVGNNYFKSQREDNLAKDLSSILSGMDKRFQNDAFELTDWSLYQPNGYEFHNKDQVQEFLSTALIAKNADGCGKINGWIPQKDDPATEDYKDKYKFITCNLWKTQMPFELNSNAKLINDGTYVTGFEMNLFFDNKKDFEDNFLSLKSVYLKSKEQNGSGDSGVYQLDFVDLASKTPLTTIECLNKNIECGLNLSFTGSDDAQAYLLVNGNNNMIGSKVKFQEDIGTTAIKTCHRYQQDTGNWIKTNDVYCGVGIGLKDPNNPSAGNLDYVELAVDSVSTNKIFLDKMCKFVASDGAMKNVPCGIYNDGAENKVIASYDEVYATDALISVLESSVLKTNDATVKTNLTVEGETTLNGQLEVNGTADFNDVVTINGAASDVNLKVTTSASLKDVDIKGALSVDGRTNINGDLAVLGSLSVGNTLTTKVIQLKDTISRADLKTNCSSYGNGTMIYYSDGNFSDLAVCANNKWKLVNTQPNQVIAFNGSCPSGFEEFTQADGRVLVGTGTLYDSASAQNMTYTLGQVGGQAKVGLTVAEMPSHSHGYTDAYFSEHWGWEGPRNQPGSNGGQDNDNNLYTMRRTSDPTGGGQAHENRMPYYVVNWCIYKG